MPKQFQMPTRKYRFQNCKSAPSGYAEGEVVELPVGYDRFPWWVPVEEPKPEPAKEEMRGK